MKEDITNTVENKIISNNSVSSVSAQEDIPFKHYNLTKTMYLRYSRFIKEYISNGFNGTQAYLSTYKGCKDENCAKAEAPRLLAITSVHNILCDQLKLIGVRLDPDWIKAEILKLAVNGKQESTRCRMLELAGKIEGLLKDNTTQNVAIFNDIDTDSIVNKRMQGIGIA